MLEKSVVEIYREMLEKSVVEKCWKEVLQRSVVEECGRRECWRRLS